MGRTLEVLADHGIVALVDPPVRAIGDWARAIGDGGVRVFGVPASLLTVTSVCDQLAEPGGAIVGVTGVVRVEQLSAALAAGAELVVLPSGSPGLIAAAKARGLDVVAGAMSPTEIGAALDAGADLVAVDPAGLLGPRYFEHLARTFRGAPLLAAGGVDVESAPRFLELGALGAIVDRGIFPPADEPAALSVITARARALVEVCENIVRARFVLSVPRRVSSAPPPPPPGLASFPPPLPRAASVPEITEIRRMPARPASVPPPIPVHARRRSLGARA